MVNIKNYYHRNQDYQELSRIFSVFSLINIVYTCVRMRVTGGKDSNSSDDKESCSILASANKIEG